MQGERPGSYVVVQSSPSPRDSDLNTGVLVGNKGFPSDNLTVVSAESRNKKVEWRWPVKGEFAWRRQLLLLLLANSYPNPLSLNDLRGILDNYNVDMGGYAFKKAVHYLYYYYQAIERVARGMYRMQDWYYEALQARIPYWRSLLRCILNCNSINYNTFRKCINTSANKDTIRYHWIPKDTIGNTSANIGIFVKNKKDEKTKTECSINKDYLIEKLRENRPALYEELETNGILDDAIDIIHLFIKKHTRGKPYMKIVGGRDGSRQFYIKLVDEARRLLGGSSSLYQKLDPMDIMETVRILVNNDILFYRRYGGEHKWRIDKDFLEEVGCNA